MDPIIETSFRFDERKHCLIPCEATSQLPRGTLQGRTDKLLRFEKTLLESDYMDAVREALKPLIVPAIDVSQHRTSLDIVPVVMCPTRGFQSLRYDLRESESLGALVRNQANALGWQLVKLTLEQIGAKVLPAQSVYHSLPQIDDRDPLRDRSTSEMFVRDPGLIYGDTFYAPAPYLFEALHRTSTDPLNLALLEMVGLGDVVGQTEDAFTEIREMQIVNILKAFKKGGKEFSLQRVDAVFEGGNTVVDSRKGIIFIGRDRVCFSRNQTGLYNDAHEHWRKSIAAATGADVIPIDCGEPRHTILPAARFHLDMLMARLPGRDLLIDPRHTSENSYTQLQKIYGREIIHVRDDNPDYIKGLVGKEVANCPANLVSVGHTLLMQNCSDTLRTDLRSKGYEVISAQDLGVHPSLFYFRGGSLDCITLRAPPLTL